MHELASSTDRPAWLAARQGGITATDVARLARGGAGTWAAIRAEKAGLARDFQNDAMRHGVEREPFILRYAEAAFGLAPCGLLLQADDRPEYLATPDALSDDEVGEAKTTVSDWPTIEEVPGRYIDQTLWQMRVTGRRRGRLIFEPHEDGIPLYPFPRDFIVDWDAARVAELEAVADEFLAGDGEPDEDAAELDRLLTAYADVEEVAAAWTAKAAARKADIEAHLAGKPRRFEGSRALLTRSVDGTSRRFDQQAFGQAHPGLLKEFTKATPRKGALRITLRGEA